MTTMVPAYTGPFAAGLALAALLTLPPVAGVLEACMVGHVVIQIPLLVMAGWLFGSAIKAAAAAKTRALLQSCNGEGIPGLLLAVFAALFWMLPRSLDATLVEPVVELGKFVSVPLLIGLPLCLSWHRLPSIVRGFVWANLVSMLAALGWLYLEAPVRLCNSYLVDQQAMLGRALLLIAAAVALSWIIHLFFNDPDSRVSRRPVAKALHR